MKRYLSSAECLEKLCKTEPDHPISYGFGKLSGGLALLGFSGVVAYYTQEFLGAPPSNEEVPMKILGYTLLGLMYGMGAAGIGYGGFLAYDGLTSLGKPFAKIKTDGNVYKRNGGFINKPSWSDKKFGELVVPIENAADLENKKFDIACINNIIIEDKTFSSEERTRTYTTYNTVTKMTTTHTEHYTVYIANILGNLKGSPIKLFAESESEKHIRGLTDRSIGDDIFIIGQKGEKHIRVDRYSDAEATILVEGLDQTINAMKKINIDEEKKIV